MPSETLPAASASGAPGAAQAGPPTTLAHEFLCWPRSAQWTAAVLLIGLLLYLGLQGLVTWFAGKGTDTAGLDLRLDLNRAPRAALLQLPGVGPSLADRILDYRHTHGHFRSVEDLRNIHGIGPATLERMRPWVYVTGNPTAPAYPVASSPPPRRTPGFSTTKAPLGKSKKEIALAGQQISLNLATATELQKLPGIGPKLSQRIVDQRSKKFFQSVDELRQVSGIGPKTLAKIRPYLTVGDADTAQLAAEGSLRK